MYCPPKLPFFIKNVPLNFTISYICLYVLILFANKLTCKKLSYIPPYFYCMSGHLFFTLTCVQEAHTPLVSTIIFNNILRLVDILPNFSSTTSEAMPDYYLQTWYTRVASRVAERLKT